MPAIELEDVSNHENRVQKPTAAKRLRFFERTLYISQSCFVLYDIINYLVEAYLSFVNHQLTVQAFISGLCLFCISVAFIWNKSLCGIMKYSRITSTIYNLRSHFD